MPDIRPFQHRVQYYETDMMGITHHANYIHWMEEARIDFMDQLGYPYRAMEAAGVISPVTNVSCDYKQPSTFGDIITISVSVASFNGVILTIRYEMKNEKGDTVCLATSGHAFLNADRHLVRMKRAMPDFCAAIEAMIPKE